MFSPNLSVKVEYLYYDLGRARFNAGAELLPVIGVGNILGNFSQTSARFNGNIARVGLNYHFNWGAAPLVAKY